MPQPSIQGVQLPVDGTGKVTPAIEIQINGVNVYIPATVLVDSSGVEIGEAILHALQELNARLEKLEKLAIQSTEALTR